MFRALGDVVHLLQDTSQPQHTRNEQHLDKIWLFEAPWHSPIETFGLKQLEDGALTFPHGVLDWRAAGFNRLKDFWDRDLYNWNRRTPTVRSAQPLIDSENPSKLTSKLGLAEFVNGNFIGDRHGYREVLPTTSPFHYPFPSLVEGTDFNQLRAHPETYGKPRFYTGFAGAGNGYVVGKTGQGRQVAYHGAVAYLFAVNPDLQGDLVGLGYAATVDDPDVLQSYHAHLIPEAIKYTAGDASPLRCPGTDMIINC